MLEPIGKIKGTSYLVGEENEEMVIDCKISTGSRPVSVTLYIDTDPVQLQTLSNTHLQYKLTLEARHHLLHINCTASNEAGLTYSAHKMFVRSSKY